MPTPFHFVNCLKVIYGVRHYVFFSCESTENSRMSLRVSQITVYNTNLMHKLKTLHIFNFILVYV
jgi:hypothetical protein